MYVNLEIRIQKQEESLGYPVELILNGNRLPRAGYLGPEIGSWQPGFVSASAGAELFDLLLAQPKLRQDWAEIRGRNQQRRIRLSLDETAAELHAIPWELLHDSTAGDLALPLTASADTPFSRYLPGIWPDNRSIAERPIKLLVIVANPANLADYQLSLLNPATERDIILQAVSGLSDDELALTFLDPPVTLSRIEAALKQGYHMLHIVAHGMFRRSMGWLFLADESNRVKRISERKFAEMINQQGQKPQLIFLASCQSASRDTADAFRGFAPQLIKAGVPTVLAMQDFVPIPTAREFTRVFYHQLFQHGQVDRAGNEARSALLTGEFPGSAIPVLFSRLQDNQLLAEPEFPPYLPQWFEPEMVLIPAGKFWMGSEAGAGISQWEEPLHEVDLLAYRIGKYPVTNEQYAEFVTKTKHPVRSEMGWNGLAPPPGKEKHPVSGVTWDDALGYCKWLAETTGRSYKLPSEAEWEKSARGTDSRVYPWGNEWTPNNYRDPEKPTTPIITPDDPPKPYWPGGASPFGCYDMAGHVREWTNSRWGTNQNAPQFKYPWQPDERENSAVNKYVLRVYRGGAANDPPLKLRCSARAAYFPDKTGEPGKRHGFRVAMKSK